MLQDSPHSLTHNSVKCALPRIKTNRGNCWVAWKLSQKSACQLTFKLSGFNQQLSNCLFFDETFVFILILKPFSVKISKNSLALWIKRTLSKVGLAAFLRPEERDSAKIWSPSKQTGRALDFPLLAKSFLSQYQGIQIFAPLTYLHQNSSTESTNCHQRAKFFIGTVSTNLRKFQSIACLWRESWLFHLDFQDKIFKHLKSFTYLHMNDTRYVTIFFL